MVMALAGNKEDLEDKRKVTTEDLDGTRTQIEYLAPKVVFLKRAIPIQEGSKSLPASLAKPSTTVTSGIRAKLLHRNNIGKEHVLLSFGRARQRLRHIYKILN
ncbi:hypothetical protein Scep_020409 [Stephania cephalantha]|uniref:Uncharacterized protein n=1 Tax=Stephania cephalantha TaxID=152367 RepID=A0AAP0ID35_9MAGN